MNLLGRLPPAFYMKKHRRYFDLFCESPYMLLVAQVKESQIDADARKSSLTGIKRLKIKRSTVPAITHVDYSATGTYCRSKPQSVFLQDNRGVL